MQFIKFIIVGVANFLVDLGILTLLNSVFGWPLLLSNTISYSCGVINSFLLNQYWTFKQKQKFISGNFLKFVLVNLLSLGINNLAIYILGELYGMENIWAKLIATMFSFIVNFAGSKLFIFKQPTAK